MNTSRKDEHKNELKRALTISSLAGESASLPKKHMPFPELPSDMVVAIDGWAQSGKNTVGELLADSIGGVLVDSGRFYRALTKACMESSIDLEDKKAVAEFCKRASLGVKMTPDGGRVAEAQVSVNCIRYSKGELRDIGAQTAKVASVPEIRVLVNTALQLCECYGRVVMLGRDIGGVVCPKTPFKFFLDAPEHIREQRHVQTTKTQGAVERDRDDQNRVVFADDAMMIDTGKIAPDEVSGIMLVEIFWRAYGKDAAGRKN
jgi:cytidylate kinase